MLLKSKNAIIYGGGGSIGGAVARAFAREGAKVFLVGRSLAKLHQVVGDVSAAGGTAEAAQVDALDEQALAKHATEVVRKADGIDICFNAVGMGDVQGTPLIEMSLEDFSRPVTTASHAQFLIAKTVALHMIKKGSGVIMMITATPSRMGLPLVGGFGTACAALEALSRQLAAELGPQGVRVICLLSAGSPESTPDSGCSSHRQPDDSDEFIASLKAATLLKRLPSLADVGNVAAIMASDWQARCPGLSPTCPVECSSTKTRNVRLGWRQNEQREQPMMVENDVTRLQQCADTAQLVKALGQDFSKEHTVDADDMRALLAAGVSCAQIEDALAVCFSFNTIGRLADAFGFFVPSPKAYEAGAKYLLARGYR